MSTINAKTQTVDTLQRRITQLQRECYGYKLELRMLKKERSKYHTIKTKTTVEPSLCEICHIKPKNVYLDCNHKMCLSCFKKIHATSKECPYDRKVYNDVNCATCNTSLVKKNTYDITYDSDSDNDFNLDDI